MPRLKLGEMESQEAGDECLNHGDPHDRPPVGGVVREIVVQRKGRRLHFLHAAHDYHSASRQGEPAIDAVEEPCLKARLHREDTAAKSRLRTRSALAAWQ